MGAIHQALLSYPPVSAGVSNVTDNFNRADNASSLGTASDGVHLWTAHVGTWGINSNRGYCPTLSGGVGFATVDYGSMDCTLEVAFATVARPMGAILRWEDASNFVRVRIRLLSTIHRTDMHVVDNGVQSASLISVDGIVWADGDVLKVVISGQFLEFFRNGVSVGSVTHTLVDNVIGTRHGLYTESTAARFDALSITP